MLVWAVGLIAVVVAFLAAQRRFYEAHRALHHEWEPPAPRWFPITTPDRSRAMLRATFRREADPVVERLRRLYLAFFALAIVYLLSSVMVAPWR